MQVFFYRLSDGPVEQALPLLAARVVGLGERLLVLAGDGAQAQAISAALWAHRPEAFLANG
ncbi:MAG TPA: DNA polymerase III subunit chi, partial [Novosphingobium sp.]|nr:DNA polymerase III subunit chi [Novosphingobium sp.]